MNCQCKASGKRLDEKNRQKASSTKALRDSCNQDPSTFNVLQEKEGMGEDCLLIGFHDALCRI